ncbi:MAG: hypothetical protein VR72_10150 [Clostridiaceae bacterium BRH_c20a]|nr:MAG: hypothetical protein VR72_10150 [Clostridiaceae bacterium BRH_c20a]
MEQLYLVAVPKTSLIDLAQRLRNQINEAFQIYGDFQPAFHVTVEVVKIQDNIDLDKAKEIIRRISKQFSPFSLEVTGFVFFPPPYKAITLAINKNNEIEILSGLIYEALREQGMIGREDFHSWKFHITVASPFGAKREWSAEEFNAAYMLVKDAKISGQCIIDTLELWRPIVTPTEMIADIFSLKG